MGATRHRVTHLSTIFCGKYILDLSLTVGNANMQVYDDDKGQHNICR
jgi:hypothetical protein